MSITCLESPHIRETHDQFNRTRVCRHIAVETMPNVACRSIKKKYIIPHHMGLVTNSQRKLRLTKISARVVNEVRVRVRETIMVNTTQNLNPNP